VTGAVTFNVSGSHGSLLGRDLGFTDEEIVAAAACANPSQPFRRLAVVHMMFGTVAAEIS
jgi:hypothetical protein